MQLKLMLTNMINHYLYDNDIEMEEFEIDKRIFDFITYHRLETIFFDYLNNTYIPTKNFYYELLQKKRDKIIFETKCQFDVAYNLYRVFEKENIPIIFIKGLPLSLSIYKKAYHRYYKDIDFIFNKNQLKNVENILLNMGYVYGYLGNNVIQKASKSDILFQKTFTHEMYSLIKHVEGNFFSEIDPNFMFSWIGIENRNNQINFELLENYKSNLLNSDFPTLNNEMMFIHLCCHFYNEAIYFELDVNYDKGDPEELKLFRIMDIIILINNLSKEQIYAIKEIAEKFNCTDRVQYVLMVIYYIFRDKYTAEFNKIFNIYSLDIENIVNYYYDKKQEKIQWGIDLESRIFDIDKRLKYFETKY